MLIKSNIKEVVAQLKRVEVGLPEALRAAAGPKYWLPRLREAAERELRAQWANEPDTGLRAFYEKITPKVVDTIIGQVFPAAILYEMFVPLDFVGTLPDIKGSAQFFQSKVVTPSGRVKKEVADYWANGPENTDKSRAKWDQFERDYARLEEVRQVILDWVQNVKKKDTRDMDSGGIPLSDENIAKRIEYILGIGLGAKPKARTDEMNAAADKLAGAIDKWMRGEDEDAPFDPPYATGRPDPEGIFHYHPQGPKLRSDVALQWLAAVLLAWQKLLWAGLPNRIAVEIRKLFTKINQDFPI